VSFKKEMSEDKFKETLWKDFSFFLGQNHNYKGIFVFEHTKIRKIAPLDFSQADAQKRPWEDEQERPWLESDKSMAPEDMGLIDVSAVNHSEDDTDYV
jgi:hypothetical protein